MNRASPTRAMQGQRQARTTSATPRSGAAWPLILAAAAGMLGCESSSVADVAAPDSVRCAVSLTADRGTLDRGGATVSIAVAAARDCAWNAGSDAGWLRLNASSGQGNGTLIATAARNDLGTARSARITVNDQQLVLSQAGQGCPTDVRGPDEPVGPAGGRRQLAISTAEGCQWTASTAAPWIVILEGAGNGSGTVTFDVQPNAGPAREAAISVGSGSSLVLQDGALCTYRLLPGSRSFAAAGGSAVVQVDTADSCPWTASSDAPWITVPQPAGAGPSAVAYSVAEHTGASARSGTLTIAGQVHTVEQSAAAAPACAYVIAPPERSFGPDGGSGVFRVETGTGCPWTVVSDADWVMVPNASGAGTALVPYTVRADDSGEPRTATVALGEAVHTVRQGPASLP